MSILISLLLVGAAVISQRALVRPPATTTMVQTQAADSTTSAASVALKSLTIKGRAPKTAYSRAQFGAGWTTTGGCDTRNVILRRDLTGISPDKGCIVISGSLADPYTGRTIRFLRGASTSSDVQIDHVVALSNAWQTGAQQLSQDRRIELANDSLELLAVDGPTNIQKSDGDAATWLPPNKAYRCQYVARQIAVKLKYQLWLTAAESETMATTLQTCPSQTLPKA